MGSAVKIVLGQIVSLTKAISLGPGQQGQHAWVQFIAGKRSRGLPGRIGLAWWANNDIQAALETVATLLITGRPEFKDCDLPTVASVVLDTLQEVCLDNTIFAADDVLAMRQNTLFDCRRAGVVEFATALHLAMEASLRRRITRHCTVYVLPRFISHSFSLDNGSLHVIARGDCVAWEELVRKGYVFDDWSPSRPKQKGRDDLVFTPKGRVDCVLAAEDHGTQKGVHFNSIMRFRQLIALLYAVASDRSKYPIHKSMAAAPEFCVQFTHRDSSECLLIRQDCRPLVPVYVEDVVIEAGDQARVAEWYSAVASANDDARSRAEKGAHFFNRGMNANDIEAFINFFISLDAVFGEQGSVEASILAGVRELGLDDRESEKTRWLFELRSELVHGGSRYIAEWPKYVRYRDHFRSEPAADVQRIARTAVLLAPDILGRQRMAGD
jgi:hypothetical protein